MSEESQNRKQMQEHMQRLLDDINSNVADSKEDLRSAFVMLSTSKNTALLVGGEKHDLRAELTKALVHMIEADPMTILIMAAAVDEYQKRQKTGTSGKSRTTAPQFDASNVDENIKAMVESALDKITKH